jgi:hypothetical protein
MGVKMAVLIYKIEPVEKYRAIQIRFTASIFK